MSQEKVVAPSPQHLLCCYSTRTEETEPWGWNSCTMHTPRPGSASLLPAEQLCGGGRSHFTRYRASFCLSGEAWFTARKPASQVQFGVLSELMWLPPSCREHSLKQCAPPGLSSRHQLMLLPPHFCTWANYKKSKQPVFLTFKLKFLPTRNLFKLWWVWDRPSSETQVNFTQVMVFCITISGCDWFFMIQPAGSGVYSQHLMYSI